MDKKKAIAAGHICLDITPAFKSKEEKSIKDLFRPGQLIAMDAAKVSLGGSVSNTGIGMKRLGADVELMGMVGNDAFGQMVLNELEKYFTGQYDCKRWCGYFIFSNPRSGRNRQNIPSLFRS